MLAILRVVIIVLCGIILSIFGCLWCLLSPGNPQNTSKMGHLFGKLSRLCGLRVIMRQPENLDHSANAIYIANHQNNYDLIVASNMAQPYTVTVGKKSLLWLPFFGQLYWLTGNLLINRNDVASAHGTINKIVSCLKTKRISFWLFPEGTRSRGRGILPFKTGAFRAALSANVPIIPVVVSNLQDKVKLNRWHNGIIIIEMLPPIDTTPFQNRPARELAAHCRSIIIDKFDDLNRQVAILENNSKR